MDFWLTLILETGGDDDTHEPAAPAASSGGKYVPPSMRGPGGARTAGAGSTREELPTLRVTNISEDTHEQDLRDLFGRFGRVTRVFIGRDRETGAGKGFAFVSFDDRAAAQKAMDKVHGMGYDNLILSVQWSRECSHPSLFVVVTLISTNRTSARAEMTVVPYMYLIDFVWLLNTIPALSLSFDDQS